MRKTAIWLLLFLLTIPSHLNAAGQTDPVFRVHTEQRVIALTFDDGPHPKYTPLLLNLLHRERVNATFFLLGKQAEKCPRITKWIYKAGHEIGNHGYSHKEMKMLSKDEITNEIEKTEKIISAIIGRKPNHFRSPYGELTPTIRKAVKETGYQMIQWSIDPKDWMVHRSAEVMARSIKDSIKPGDIILFHDGGGNQKEMLEAVKSLIHTLKKKNYRFVTVSELLEME